MANLLGQNIGTNYKGILNLDSTINTPLDATLRAVTDGDGNASGLKLSTTDSSFSGKLGIGTNAPTATTHIIGVDQLSTSTSLLVQDSIGTNILRVHNQANNSAVVMSTAKIANYEIISGDVLFNTSMRFVPTTGGVAINKDYSSASSNTLVHLKGSGTTSATTSLLVQNSSGTEVLKVTDDSVTNARGTINVLHPSVAARSLKLGWGSIFATDSGSELTLGAVFAVPSSPQILLAGNTRSSGANTMQLQASLGVSIAASLINPSAQLHIKGSGSTSATTSLLVQNSAGNSALTILDNLNSQFGGTVTSDGGFRSIAYFDSFQRVALNNGLNTNPQNYLISGGFGRILLVDNSEGDFNRLQFGGTTSSFPSLKRNGTAIDVRLADDSNYAQFNTGATLIKGSGNTSATTSLLVQNSDGTQLFKINDNRDVFLGSSTNYIHQGVFFQGDYHGVGNWNFGTASNLGARLGIKGSGATSATTALLVQNSAGTEAFKVNDAGDLFFNGLETSSMRIHTLGNTNKGISIDNEMDMGAFYGITFKTWDGSAYSNFMRINGNTASRGLIIGGTTNDASAKLQIDSTTQGFLPPRMTQAEILAIAAPATGLMAYNLDIGQVCVFDGAIWHKLSQSHM